MNLFSIKEKKTLSPKIPYIDANDALINLFDKLLYLGITNVGLYFSPRSK